MSGTKNYTIGNNRNNILRSTRQMLKIGHLPDDLGIRQNTTKNVTLLVITCCKRILCHLHNLHKGQSIYVWPCRLGLGRGLVSTMSFSDENASFINSQS